MSLPAFSLRQAVLVNLLFAVLMVAGFQVQRRIPVDVQPDVAFPFAVLVTIWSGASADEVERLVTTKLEEEIDEVLGVKQLTSFSSQGQSEIQVEWEETLSELEYESALSDLRAAIDRVNDLPGDAEEPVLIELSMHELNPVVMVALVDTGGAGEFVLRDTARALERKLEQLWGVRKVNLRGERDRELRVYVDRDRAYQFDLTLPEISRLIGRANQNFPGGSFTDPADQEITVRGLGQFVSPESLAETVVVKSPDGTHVRLGDVAEVEHDFEKRVVYGRYNGRPTILLQVTKNVDSDAIDLVDRVRALVDAERPFLPAGVEAHITWDFSKYVDARLGLMRSNLAMGIAFVVVILWFSVGFRNALLAIIGVPFAFLTALLFFPKLGITINSLSLVGFVMVSGMLVDDAIIVLENIYRHIEEGAELRRAIVRGTEEVMWPISAAVATTIAAFLPMLMVSGPAGEFMEILPKTVALCLLASLFECLLILPAHYLDFGTRTRPDEDEIGTRRGLSALSYRLRARVDAAFDRARDAYGRAQRPVLRHRYAFLGLSLAALFFATSLAQHVPVDLFPGDFNNMFVTVQTPTDFGIDQTNEVALEMEAALDDLSDELTDFSTFVGQGMLADWQPVFEPNYALFFVSFPNTYENMADPFRVLNLVRDRLDAVWKADPERIENVLVLPPQSGPPVGTPVAIRVQADDYDQAKRIAGEIEGELSTIPGVFDIEDNVPAGPRELRVAMDEERAGMHGLSFDDIGQALRSANDGLIASSFRDPLSDEDVDIRVLLREDQRRSIRDLLDVDVRTPLGHRVKVGDVASIDVTRGYQRLYHYDTKRTVTAYARVDNEQATSISVNREIEARFADTSARYPGVNLIYGGEFEMSKRAMEDVGRALLVALLAIYAILAAQFRSYLQPVVVMSTVAFAYIGVILGIWALDYTISMYMLYAMVGLAGIVVNDSLVLIDFVNKERERGTSLYEAVRVASVRRFRPIMLTTVTTIAGLAPMALGLQGKSRVFAPFAACIVFGLAVASLLTLFVVPAMYVILEDAKARLTARTPEPAPQPLAGER